jgi:L-threonylcarbamoyladenylate synthase
VSPTTASDAEDDLRAYLMQTDMVLDGGPCRIGVESTIVDLTTEVPQILRPGGCSIEQIEEVLGRATARVATGPSRAPGMLEAHYAPMAGVLVVDAARMAETVRAGIADGKRVGLLGPRTLAVDEPSLIRLAVPDEYSGESLSPILYARLREADRLGLDLLVVVGPPGEGLGRAVNDRLQRAERGSSQVT